MKEIRDENHNLKKVMENEKKRVPELNLASIVFMLLVIFIHVASECVSNYVTTSLPFAVMCSAHRLSSFVVQGFLFLSGVKLFLPRDNNTFSYQKFYLSRFKRVIIPYLIVFVLFCLYFTVSGRVKFDLSYFIHAFLTGGMVEHFYFVFIICQFYLLMPLWRLISKRCSALLSLFLSLMIMLICRAHLPEITQMLFGYQIPMNSRLFTTFLFYFICGMFVGQHYDRFTEMLKIHFRGITAMFVLTGAVDCVLIWVIRNGIYYPSWADDFHVIYCIAAILFVMCVIRKLSAAALTNSHTVKLLSASSYNVYLIHPLFIFLCDSLLDRFKLASLTGRFAVRFITVYILSIGVCTLWEYTKAKIKTSPSSVEKF